jgi:hypothetical protein
MSAGERGVNHTSVTVVWWPATGGNNHPRGTIQITVHPSKQMGEEEHIAFQNLLSAVKRLQELGTK